MSTVLLLLSVAVTALWFYYIWSRRRFYRLYWHLRGPLGLPFIGLGLQMMKPEKFLQYMQDKGQQYKTPFVSWMGTKCFLYVNDPQTIETIFNSPCCTNKGDLYRFMANAIGDGLFTSSAPRWNKHRRLITPSFSRQVIHTFFPIFNRESNVLINKLAMTEGQPLEIYEILKRNVLEIACQTTMGTKMGFHNDGADEIFESYNGVTDGCVKRMLSPWLYPDILYKNSSLFKRQQKYISVLRAFVENLFEKHDKIKIPIELSAISTETERKATDRITNRHENNENRKVYKSHTDDHMNNAIKDYNKDFRKFKSRVFIELVQSHIEEGQLTWEDVRDEANVIVAATYETTSTALYFVCLCLAMHPEKQDKLYNELVAIFPTKFKQENGRSKLLNYTPYLENDPCNEKSENLILTDITIENLERMTYAEMVINEAMRLFAPVPMVLRQASSDFQLSNGTIIPEGTQIGIDIFNMQRSRSVWGPNANTFNPDIHFGGDHKSHPFAFIPFTKGLRMCIGYRYALILMKIILAKIFRNFRVHTDATMHDITVKGTISLKLCQYPLCKLEKRKNFN